MVYVIKACWLLASRIRMEHSNSSNLFLEWKSTCFGQSNIKSFSLYTQQWYMSYRFAYCFRAVSKPVWHIPLLCVQRKTRDDGQRNCQNYVEFRSKNKFEQLVRLVGFITRNLTRCTVTWTSNALTYRPMCKITVRLLFFILFSIQKYSLLNN